ncbi:MAG: TIGR00282 family metallophosphoesterase [candidate division WOR-3 bacterium]
MRILVLGDICGRWARIAAIRSLPELRRQFEAQMVIANGENAAAGYGLTPAIVHELIQAGVDCITTGDHFLDRKEVAAVLAAEDRLLRPANYPVEVPGRGCGIFSVSGVPVAVINLQGRVFMKPIDCPFRRAKELLKDLHTRASIILVDFHAEATAEKVALGWFLDGQVSAVIGTHTHVATADERVLPSGTAYITDIGMCGGRDSVLGMERDRAIQRMMLGTPLRLAPERQHLQLAGVTIEVGEDGRAKAIERFIFPVVLPGAEDGESVLAGDGQKI